MSIKFTLCTYATQVPGIRRVLTIQDQQKMVGVPIKCSELVWDRSNNWRLDITDVHPLVIVEIRKLDDFDVSEISDDFSLDEVQSDDLDIDTSGGDSLERG
jgi:hypothetical protein